LALGVKREISIAGAGKALVLFGLVVLQSLSSTTARFLETFLPPSSRSSSSDSVFLLNRFVSLFNAKSPSRAFFVMIRRIFSLSLLAAAAPRRFRASPLIFLPRGALGATPKPIESVQPGKPLNYVILDREVSSHLGKSARRP